jgi:hypothetical protein
VPDKATANKHLLGNMRVNNKKKIQPAALMEELRLNDLSETEKELVDRLLVVMTRFRMLWWGFFFLFSFAFYFVSSFFFFLLILRCTYSFISRAVPPEVEREVLCDQLKDDLRLEVKAYHERQDRSLASARRRGSREMPKGVLSHPSLDLPAEPLEWRDLKQNATMQSQRDTATGLGLTATWDSTGQAALLYRLPEVVVEYMTEVNAVMLTFVAQCETGQGRAVLERQGTGKAPISAIGSKLQKVGFRFFCQSVCLLADLPRSPFLSQQDCAPHADLSRPLHRHAGHIQAPAGLLCWH